MNSHVPITQFKQRTHGPLFISTLTAPLYQIILKQNSDNHLTSYLLIFQYASSKDYFFNNITTIALYLQKTPINSLKSNVQQVLNFQPQMVFYSQGPYLCRWLIWLKSSHLQVNPSICEDLREGRYFPSIASQGVGPNFLLSEIKGTLKYEAKIFTYLSMSLGSPGLVWRKGLNILTTKP